MIESLEGYIEKNFFCPGWKMMKKKEQSPLENVEPKHFF